MSNSLRNVFHDIAEAIRSKGITGTFKPIDMAQKILEIKTGENYGYLTFTAEEVTTLTLKQNGSISPHKLLKSTDGVNWVKWENPATNGISLNAGQSVYLKADEDSLWRIATDSNNYNQFSSSGKIKCNGDIRPLVKPIALEDYSYFARGLFYNCTSLIQAPELPATTLANYCYSFMFYGCTSLTQAPELPATTLANYCYANMFQNCTSLTKAPVLPSTTLANNCYQYMFYGCTSLTNAPVLPSTTLANYCYSNMFNGCTSLTQAPKLPATTLASSCYQSMFYYCTSLTTAPKLPATTLARGCYSNMFNGCTSLKRIKMNSSSGSWGTYMFTGCTSLELVDMTGSTGVPTLSNVNNFDNTNDTYKIVVPDSLYDTWIAATNWVSIASHIMKQSDWNSAHPDDILG